MLISDWSSDVCSSDLRHPLGPSPGTRRLEPVPRGCILNASSTRIMPMTTDGDKLVTEAEIDGTVALFYGRARDDELLGPVFRAAIPDAQWNDHIARIAAFWSKTGDASCGAGVCRYVEI